jgi:hypothetical protein
MISWDIDPYRGLSMRQTSGVKTPFILFLLIGIILLLFSWIYRGDIFLFNLLVQVGSAVILVTIVETIWKFWGGDPITKAIYDLKFSTSLLTDLDGTGIKRIYTVRKNVDFTRWSEYIKSAGSVDMMGIVLFRDWLSEETILQEIQRRIVRKECKFRILLLDPNPNSPITKQRIIEEAQGKGENWPVEGNPSDIEEKIKSLKKDDELRVTGGVRTSLQRLKKIYMSLNKASQRCLQVKTITRSGIYCYIIRADNRMLVAIYLSHCHGSHSPAFEIHGEDDNSLFKLFSDEFNKMWRLGEPCFHKPNNAV